MNINSSPTKSLMTGEASPPRHYTNKNKQQPTDVTKKPSVYVRLRNTPVEFKINHHNNVHQEAQQQQPHVLHSRLAPANVKSRLNTGDHHHSSTNNHSDSYFSLPEGCVSILDDSKTVIVHAPSKCNYAHLPPQQHWFEFDGAFSALDPTEAQTMMPTLKEQHIHNARNPLMRENYAPFERSLTSPAGKQQQSSFSVKSPQQQQQSSNLMKGTKGGSGSKKSSSSSSFSFPKLPVLKETPPMIEDEFLFDKVVQPALGAVTDLRVPGLFVCYGMTSSGKTRTLFGSEAQNLSSVHNNLVTAHKGEQQQAPPLSFSTSSTTTPGKKFSSQQNRQQTTTTSKTMISPTSVYSTTLAIAQDPSNHLPNPGLVQLTCNKLLEQYPLGICVSFFEVYNEKLRCLLSGREVTPMLTPEGMVFRDLARSVVRSNGELRKKINEGMKMRKAASTDRNDHSSRSHAILQMHPILELREVASEDDNNALKNNKIEEYILNSPLHNHQQKTVSRSITVSSPSNNDQHHHDISQKSNKNSSSNNSKIKFLPMISERIRFTMVDLAGSERLTTSSKAQLKESTFINRALSNLSRVIQSLSNLRNKNNNNNSDETDSSSNNMTKNVDPECRSSALTWALRDELQFKTAVTFLITISPMTVHANESLSSLRFASMLSSIRTVIKVGQQQGGSLSSHELKIASELMARNLDLKRQNTNPNTHVPLMEMSPSRYGNPVALKSASPARNRNSKNKNKNINGKNGVPSEDKDNDNDNDTLVASPQARRPSSSVSHASPATKAKKSSISTKSAAVRNPFSTSPPRASAAAAPIVTFAADVEKENRSTSVVKITMENATTQYSPTAVRTNTNTQQDETQNQREEKNLHHQMLYEEERLNQKENEEELLDEIIEFSPAISNQQNLNTEEQKEEQEQEEDNDSVPVCAMSMEMPIGDDDNDTNEEETSSSPHFNHLFEASPNRVRTTTTTTTSAGSSTIPDLDEIEEQAAAASRALLLSQQNDDRSDFSTSPSRKQAVRATSSVASSSVARTDNTFAFITSANLIDVSSIDSIVIDKTDEQQVSTSSNRRFANIKNRNHHHQLRIFSASTPILNLGDCDLFVAGTLRAVQSWRATFKKSSTYRQEYIISCVILADDDKTDETETETLSCFVLSRSSKHLVDEEILSANQEMFSSSPSQSSCSPSPARRRSNWNWWGTFWSNEKCTRNGLSSRQQIAKITRARQTQSVFVSEEDQLAFALQHGDSLDLLSLLSSSENNMNMNNINLGQVQQQQQSLLQLRFTLIDASRGPVLGFRGQQQQRSQENISLLSSHLMMESKLRSREEIAKEEKDFSDHHQENEKHQQRRSVSFKQEEKEITTNCTTTSRSVANFVTPHSEKSLFSSDEKCSQQQQKAREAASISSTSSSGNNIKRSSMMSNNYSYSTSVASSAPVTEPSPTNKRNHFEDEQEIPSTSTSINPSAANSKQNSRERDDDDDGNNNDNQEPQPINPIHHQQHNNKNENQTTTTATTSFSASASIVAVNSFSSSVLNSASVSRAGTSASPIVVRDENDDEDETDFYYEEVEEIVDVLQDDVNDENIFTVAGENNNNKKFVTRTRLVKKPRKEVMMTTTATSRNKFSISSTRKSLTTNNSATTSADRCGSSISVAISEDGLGQIDENYLHDSDKNNTSGNYGFMMLNNKQKKNGGRRNNNSRGSSTSKSTKSAKSDNKSLSGNTSTRSSVSPSVSSFSGSLMTTPRGGQLPLSARGTKKRFATPLDAIRVIATSSDTQQQQLINQTSMKNSASASSPATFFRKFKARIGSMLNTNSASSQAPKKVSGLEIAQQHQEQEKTEKIISNLKSNNKNKKNLMTFSKSPNRGHHRGVSLSLEREEEIIEQGKSSLKNLVDSRRSTSRKWGKSLDNSNKSSSSFHQSSSSSLTMKRHLSHLSP